MTFRIHELLYLGASRRQLQWWDERRIIKPRIMLHARNYTPGQALEVAITAHLRRRGWSLKTVRKVLAHYRIQVHAKRLKPKYLLVEKRGGCACLLNTNGVVEAARHALRGVVLVDLSELEKKCSAGRPGMVHSKYDNTSTSSSRARVRDRP
jgi:DNA-binding transcriptional MerR regulator